MLSSSVFYFIFESFPNTIIFLFLVPFSDDGQVTRRDTTMTFMMFVNCDLFNAYACRSSERCFYEISFYSNPTFLWAIGGSVFGQLMVIYFPPLQEVFQTEALSVYDLFYIVLLSSSILMLDTLRKKFFASVCTDPIGRMMMKEGKHHKKTDEPANKQGGLNKVSNFFHQRKPMSATKGKRKKRSVRQRNSLTVDI
jgi:magnesium-transporting ATPase (P-type)